MTNLPASSTTNSLPDGIGWLYSNPSKQTSQEDYLLGKPIEGANPNELRQLQTTFAFNAPNRSDDGLNARANEEALRRLREDPLFIIKQVEIQQGKLIKAQQTLANRSKPIDPVASTRAHHINTQKKLHKKHKRKYRNKDTKIKRHFYSPLSKSSLTSFPKPNLSKKTYTAHKLNRKASSHSASTSNRSHSNLQQSPVLTSHIHTLNTAHSSTKAESFDEDILHSLKKLDPRPRSSSPILNSSPRKYSGNYLKSHSLLRNKEHLNNESSFKNHIKGTPKDLLSNSYNRVSQSNSSSSISLIYSKTCKYKHKNNSNNLDTNSQVYKYSNTKIQVHKDKYRPNDQQRLTNNLSTDKYRQTNYRENLYQRPDSSSASSHRSAQSLSSYHRSRESKVQNTLKKKVDEPHILPKHELTQEIYKTHQKLPNKNQKRGSSNYKKHLIKTDHIPKTNSTRKLRHSRSSSPNQSAIPTHIKHSPHHIHHQSHTYHNLSAKRVKYKNNDLYFSHYKHDNHCRSSSLNSSHQSARNNYTNRLSSPSLKNRSKIQDSKTNSFTTKSKKSSSPVNHSPELPVSPQQINSHKEHTHIIQPNTTTFKEYTTAKNSSFVHSESSECASQKGRHEPCITQTAKDSHHTLHLKESKSPYQYSHPDDVKISSTTQQSKDKKIFTASLPPVNWNSNKIPLNYYDDLGPPPSMLKKAEAIQQLAQQELATSEKAPQKLTISNLQEMIVAGKEHEEDKNIRLSKIATKEMQQKDLEEEWRRKNDQSFLTEANKSIYMNASLTLEKRINIQKKKTNFDD